MADEMNERTGMVTGTISVDVTVLEEITELLARLEALPEFPLEPFLALLDVMLEDCAMGAREPARTTSDECIVFKLGGVFELYAAALRALQGHLGHD